ncbi:unnamed protein product [Candidula unifasciata]|uniref:Serpin domain-containing protein n=1 Tax=Candidula unifasciata TaxID=100452 RepID=A0A8S3ZKK6_9EUPU|nr:unnamed protein product [Candidula unifasciata]
MNQALINVCLLLAVSLAQGDDVQTLSSATRGFSQQLYQKIALDKPNTVFSGYSIHSALSMTLLGARGDTAAELSTVLGLTALTGNSSHLAYRDLIDRLNSAEKVKLHTANALFVNPNIPIEAQFVADTRTYYQAKVENFDLAAAGGPEKQINVYVENKTEGVIKDLLSKGSVSASTSTVLVNTVFFNGTWLRVFSAGKTQPRDFRQLGGKKSQVSMMNDDRSVNIKRNVLGADVAELPFVGNRFALYIALPTSVDGITELETALAVQGNVEQLFQGLTSRRVKLSIPKFRVESQFGLNEPLKQLGLVQPFSPSSANFQGISRVDRLVITDVLHKAVIETTETGTTAAAATAVIVGLTSVMEPPAELFDADHPFLFFLVDKETNSTLFEGKFSG